jgi:CrcB protein
MGEAKTVLWVAVGGACGAVLRYAAQTAATAWSLPGGAVFGTWFVNVAGCLTIGMLLGAFAGAPWFEAGGRAFLVVGVLGAFTTFSAFSADTLMLYSQGRLVSAVAYAAATVAACIVAAFAGYRLFGALQ